MSAVRDVLVLTDQRMDRHKPEVEEPFLPGRLETRIREILEGLDVKWLYPEHPGRIRAILDTLKARPIPGLRLGPGHTATREQLARVHTTGYLDDIESFRGKTAWLDVDTTAVSAGSVEAAEVAAGTAVAAVEAVCKGEAGSAFALIRPPGHHAQPARARGFCLFNNTAVAGAHAQAALGLTRVMVLDWDVHHGNGTQDIFWADPDTLFIDIHRAAPFYPGSGFLTEVGGGIGEGATVNVPLPAGAGDAALVKTLSDIVVPAADWFQPELVIVSAGFDAHRLDLALNATERGFAAMTGVVQAIADRHCDGRLVFVLEGGYHTESLSESVHAVLEVLAGATPAPVEEPGLADATPAPEENPGLDEVAEAAEYHRTAFASPYE